MNHHEPNWEYGIKMLIHYSKKAKKGFLLPFTEAQATF